MATEKLKNIKFGEKLYTAEEVNQLLSGKQDVLSSGDSIVYVQAGKLYFDKKEDLLTEEQKQKIEFSISQTTFNEHKNDSDVHFSSAEQKARIVEFAGSGIDLVGELDSKNKRLVTKVDLRKPMTYKGQKVLAIVDQNAVVVGYVKKAVRKSTGEEVWDFRGETTPVSSLDVVLFENGCLAGRLSHIYGASSMFQTNQLSDKGGGPGTGYDIVDGCVELSFLATLSSSVKRYPVRARGPEHPHPWDAIVCDLDTCKISYWPAGDEAKSITLKWAGSGMTEATVYGMYQVVQELNEGDDLSVPSSGAIMRKLAPDAELSEESEKPIQNKAATKALNAKQVKVELADGSEMSGVCDEVPNTANTTNFVSSAGVAKNTIKNYTIGDTTKVVSGIDLEPTEGNDTRLVTSGGVKTAVDNVLKGTKIQLGNGTNNTDKTLKFLSWPLVDRNGNIVSDRIPGYELISQLDKYIHLLKKIPYSLEKIVVNTDPTGATQTVTVSNLGITKLEIRGQSYVEVKLPDKEQWSLNEKAISRNFCVMVMSGLPQKASKDPLTYGFHLSFVGDVSFVSDGSDPFALMKAGERVMYFFSEIEDNVFMVTRDVLFEVERP